MIYGKNGNEGGKMDMVVIVLVIGAVLWWYGWR
jgi:hypothetical protein